MGHIDYKTAFSRVVKQRNVMAFVGNGFDIQVMHDYGSPVDTRYESFYHFLKLRSFEPDNPILQKMEALRGTGKEDWSDVEGAVEKLLAGRRAIRVDALATALKAMQSQFAEFLDLAVPSSLLAELGADSMKNKWAIKSMAEFLGDLPEEAYKRSAFPGRTDNRDLYNFVFVNFNYTALLDDVVYLDQVQFDPLPNKTVDRNFIFEGNPRGVKRADVRPGDTFSSYLMTDVIHPHGHQSIPRSLLFGIDEPDAPNGQQDPKLRLAKPFWAQNRRRFKHLIDDTELFIMFGCSMGEVDRWWWSNIAGVLGRVQNDSNGVGSYRPELIIYWYNAGPDPLTEDEVRAKFLNAADTPVEDPETFIHVVLHDNTTDRIWLRTS